MAFVSQSDGVSASDSSGDAFARQSGAHPVGIRVIFLDIDGVLNRTLSATHIRVDDDLVGRLRDLVASGDARIVLSTFWRGFDEYIAYVLSRYGIGGARDVGGVVTRVVGRTSDHTSPSHGRPGPPGIPKTSPEDRSAADAKHYENRTAEILEWLAAHPEVEGFVVLDDRASAGQGPLGPRFVHVKTKLGLTQEDVEHAATMLALPRPEGV